MTEDFDLLLGRLQHRVTSESRPLALVLGAAVSQQEGRGVGSVKDIVSAGLAAHPGLDSDQSLLRAVESGATDLGDIYRQFMGRLVKGRGRPAADELVREAVMRAWQRPDPPDGDGLLPKDLDGWQLTDGLVALADLIEARPAAFPVVVTTNFDPLVEVALRRKGISTSRRVITADAPIRETDSTPGADVQIVHVHGFWHGAPTMHTPEQLMYSRPRLQAALISTLKLHDVFVIGYGGWDDVVTGALESLTLDDGAKAEVLWAFYESDPVVLEVRNRTLLGRVGRLIIEGLFHQYAGIDCHRLLPALARTGVAASSVTATSLGGPPSGWVLVDDALLQGAEALLSDRDLRTFFDGRPPDWALMSSSTIPHLRVVDALYDRLVKKTRSGPVWQFLLAPAGDGKSTAIMQAGRRLLGAGWRVIWRPHAGVLLEPAELELISDNEPTVIIIDDADTCAPELAELAARMEGKHNLHLIAAARLSDWRHTGVQIDAMETVETVVVSLEAMSRREGRELVGAWGSVPNGLGQLAEIADGEARLARLLDAVATDRRSNGSLLGGLFRLRYDRASLDAHVNDLLDSLERRQIPESHVSLLRAFAYVCAVEVVGLDGIDRRLWAELLGVDVRSLRRTVEYSLGAEAATARAGGLVQVRHPELANSAIRLLRSRSRDIDLAAMYAEIVESAIGLGKYMDLRGYSEIVHLGVRTPDALAQLGYTREESYSVALSAARASVEAEPNLVVYQTDYGSLLRKSGNPRAALELYEAADGRLRSFRDRQRAQHGLYFDYGISYAEYGDPRSALLVNIQAWGLEPSKGRQASGRYLVQLAKSFLKIYEESQSDRARLSLAGVLKVAELAMISQGDYEWCQRSAKSGHAPPTDKLDSRRALQLLENGLTAATRECSAEISFGRYKPGAATRLIQPLLRDEKS